jgi:2-oxoglutarate ferredoxin oxidoreductase subunit gamma
MRQEVLIAGSGGQGVISTSVILGKAFGLFSDYEVAQTQSYGPEARGGACKAGLVYSDEVIDFMKVTKPDIFIVFNQAAFQKYSHALTEDTIIFADTTYVKEESLTKYKNVYRVTATSIAEKELKPFVANIIMLGAMTKVIDVLDIDSIKKSIENTFQERHLPMNYKALEIGQELL